MNVDNVIFVVDFVLFFIFSLILVTRTNESKLFGMLFILQSSDRFCRFVLDN